MSFISNDMIKKIENIIPKHINNQQVPKDVLVIINDYIPKLNDGNIRKIVKDYLSKNENKKQQVINKYGSINNWDVSQVTDMNGLFWCKDDFNQPLNNWDVSNVTSMKYMFYHAYNFNQFINNWNLSQVTTMKAMFESTIKFNQPLNNWNVSNVTNMSYMFKDTDSFDQPIDNWNVSSVTNMKTMFNYAKKFNQPLNNWNVSNVTNMLEMFFAAIQFNQPLNNWNVSNVKNMNNIFDNTTQLNHTPYICIRLDMFDLSNMQELPYTQATTLGIEQPQNNWNVSNICLENLIKNAYGDEERLSDSNESVFNELIL